MVNGNISNVHISYCTAAVIVSVGNVSPVMNLIQLVVVFGEWAT